MEPERPPRHGLKSAAPIDQRAVSFRLLVWLRWGAVAGQSVVIAIVDRTLGIGLPLFALIAVLGIEVVSNVACMEWLRRGGTPSERFIGALMAFDVLLLTALLYLTGGPYNPFNFLYVVHIALAAAVLRPRWTWGLVTLALGCFAALFLDHVPLPSVSPNAPGVPHNHDHMGLHMKGMWVAFGIAALFIAYFGNRVTRALGERDRQLAQIRAEKTRSERLAALATLAAGAAHELSTPLSTIAVVAAELEALLQEHNAEPSTILDAQLIAQEVKRCRHILQQMAGHAGQSPGENLQRIEVKALVDTALEGLDLGAVKLVVEIEPRLGQREIRVPLVALAQTVRGLIKNAMDASPSNTDLVLDVSSDGEQLRIDVVDHGRGMDEDELARAVEPFFTTKETGKGMGLGLFLAHELARQLGGSLELESKSGSGTRASILLPIGTATFGHIARGSGLDDVRNEP